MCVYQINLLSIGIRLKNARVFYLFRFCDKTTEISVSLDNKLTQVEDHTKQYWLCSPHATNSSCLKVVLC